MANWNQLAEDNYSAAQSLMSGGHWRSVLSRAYYAVYAKVSAELARCRVKMPAGREGPSHDKLPDLVVTHMARPDRNRRRTVRRLVVRLYDLRVGADYRPSFQVGSSEARTAARMMVDVFRLC